jgi:hypothetical protein
MNNYIVLCILTLWSFTANSQVPLILNAPVVSSQYGKLLSAAPVYRMSGSVIMVNKMQGQPVEKTIRTQLPVFAENGDTGYFFLRSGTAEQSALKGYITILVHHCCDGKPLQLYIDQNSNFNFTDDGPAVSWTRNESEKDIYLLSPSDTSIVVTYRLSRFNAWGKDTYLGMLDEYYKREEKNRQFAGIRFSFREQRLNCKGGYFVNQQDSVTIGLLDVNQNGLYNDVGIDRVMVTDHGQTVLSFESEDGISVSTVQKDVQLEYNGSAFYLEQIDPLGRSVLITVGHSGSVAKGFKKGETFPALKFNSWNDKKLRLRRIARKHPVYIHVIQFPYDNFQSDTTLFVQLLRQYPDLRIIWLQYGGRPNNVSIIAQLPNVTWFMGHTRLSQNREMHITRYPFGILLDKKRKVYQFDCSTSMLKEILKERECKK